MIMLCIFSCIILLGENYFKFLKSIENALILVLNILYYVGLMLRLSDPL